MVVGDIARDRAFQVYGSDGDFDRNARVGDDLLGVRGRIYPDGGGRDAVVLSGDLITIETMRPAGEVVPPGKRPILRLALDGDKVVRETITYAWAPPSAGTITFRVGGQEITTGDQTPPPRTFDPGLFVGPLPGGGVAFSDSSAYEIKVVDADGAISRILSRPFHPQPVTDRILEAEIKRQIEEFAEQQAAMNAQPRIVVDGRTGDVVDGVPRDMMLDGLKRSQAHLSRIPAVRGRQFRSSSTCARPGRAGSGCGDGATISSVTARSMCSPWMAAIWGAIRARPPCRTPLVPTGWWRSWRPTSSG